MRSAILLLLAVTLVPGVSLAAETTTLHKGIRVRLRGPSVPAAPLTGVLADLTTDSIRINPERGGVGLSLPRQRIDQLEVSTGRRRYTLLGAGLGLAIGAGIGAATGSSWDPGIEGRAINMYWGALVYGAVGLALGTVIGASQHSERWMRVPLDAQPASEVQGYLPAPGMRVGLGLGF